MRNIIDLLNELNEFDEDDTTLANFLAREDWLPDSSDVDNYDNHIGYTELNEGESLLDTAMQGLSKYVVGVNHPTTFDPIEDPNDCVDKDSLQGVSKFIDFLENNTVGLDEEVEFSSTEEPSFVDSSRDNIIANSIVKIKSWEDLLEVGLLDSKGDINLGDAFFVSNMRYLCGKTIVLDSYAMYDKWDITPSMCSFIDYWAAIDDYEEYEFDGEPYDDNIWDSVSSNIEGIDLSFATVTIKSWEDLITIGEFDADGDIYLGHGSGFFTQGMRHLCGETLALDGDYRYDNWAITAAMCDEIKYPTPQSNGLETGMIIRDGFNQLAKVFMNTQFGSYLVYQGGTWINLDELEAHWSNEDYLDYKIHEVLIPNSIMALAHNSWNLNIDYTSIWEREDNDTDKRVAMSLEEIEEELGFKIDLI